MRATLEGIDGSQVVLGKKLTQESTALISGSILP
jgi:hypothetical protein